MSSAVANGLIWDMPRKQLPSVICRQCSTSFRVVWSDSYSTSKYVNETLLYRIEDIPADTQSDLVPHCPLKWHWGYLLFINVFTDLPYIYVLHFCLNHTSSKLAVHVCIIMHHIYLAYTFSSNPATTGSRIRQPFQNLFIWEMFANYHSAKVIRKQKLNSGKFITLTLIVIPSSKS